MQLTHSKLQPQTRSHHLILPWNAD